MFVRHFLIDSLRSDIIESVEFMRNHVDACSILFIDIDSPVKVPASGKGFTELLRKASSIFSFYCFADSIILELSCRFAVVLYFKGPQALCVLLRF